MIDYEIINTLADDIEEWAVVLRRHFHRWPELGNDEYVTSRKVIEELESIGIETSRVLETGVVGILKGEKPGKVIALRADMDGLPIEETTDLPFTSERRGLMHACGHDVHMAVLLGTARLLAEIKENIHGTIKFIFQPAEETSGGAERMIEKGCLDNPKVDCILGIHVKPDLPAGTIGIKYGKVHAASDTFKITITGSQSHGAYPDRGVDAILAAAQVINNGQSIISRNISPLNSAVITFGKIHGGAAMNIIADKVTIEGTIRALDMSAREYLRERLWQITNHTAKSLNASAKIEFTDGYHALINDNLVVDLIKEAVVYGSTVDKVIELQNPSMGVEDFAFFLEKVPGAFFFLGSGYKNKDNPGIHSGNFEVDESCIKTGILACSLSALQLLE
ncbi:MAG: M20 metallopeptidase family protein [Anaerovoracaceae bacterium]